MLTAWRVHLMISPSSYPIFRDSIDALSISLYLFNIWYDQQPYIYTAYTFIIFRFSRTRDVPSTHKFLSETNWGSLLCYIQLSTHDYFSYFSPKKCGGRNEARGFMALSLSRLLHRTLDYIWDYTNGCSYSFFVLRALVAMCHRNKEAIEQHFAEMNLSTLTVYYNCFLDDWVSTREN